MTNTAAKKRSSPARPMMKHAEQTAAEVARNRKTVKGRQLLEAQRIERASRDDIESLEFLLDTTSEKLTGTPTIERHIDVREPQTASRQGESALADYYLEKFDPKFCDLITISVGHSFQVSLRHPLTETVLAHLKQIHAEISSLVGVFEGLTGSEQLESRSIGSIRRTYDRIQKMGEPSRKK